MTISDEIGMVSAAIFTTAGTRLTVRHLTIYRGILFFMVLLYPFDSRADLSIYTIEEQIQAAFPAQPKYLGDAGEGQKRTRGYQIADELNLIFYSVVWQLGEIRFSYQDVPEAPRNYARGDALGVAGKVVSFKFTEKNEAPGAHYVIRYKLDNFSVRKYSATIYHGGKFHSWSVQEFIGVSRQSAEQIFNWYVEYFTLKHW